MQIKKHKKILFVGVLLLLCFLAGIFIKTRKPIFTGTADLVNSKQKWQELEKKHNFNYIYTVDSASWTGSSSTIKITVKDNKVVAREYKASNPNDFWSEDNNSLGSHDIGDSIKTIDDLYAQCISEVLPRSLNKDEKLHLNFNEQGILKSCTTINQNCADDCSQGVVISTVSR